MTRSRPCPLCHGSGELETTVGERVRAEREKRKWSQDETARIMGVSRPTLANIETGRQEVSSFFLVGFANLFGVTTDYLLGRDEK
jgi:transcriptional regulator with XRE-family HTH domain